MNLNGVLLINKPAGMTSHDVVSKVRYVLKMKAVGHAGTLDPMATGLLVLLLGEATKISNHVLNEAKSYRAQILLGKTTDTDDITGNVISENPVSVEEKEVKSALSILLGEQNLPVPKYSAIKVNGEKLYSMAREGEDFVAPFRTMNFFNFEDIQTTENTISLHLHCSKGSYIRSFAVAIGNILKCGATLSSLHRTSSSPFQVDLAISLDKLRDLVSSGESAVLNSEAFVPLHECLAHWPGISVDGLDEKLLMNGQLSHGLEQLLYYRYLPLMDGPTGVRVMSKRRPHLLALLEISSHKKFKVQRVFSRPS